MRIAIYGAGGVGGYFGGVLARAGHEVALIARGAHLDAIRSHGLRVRTPSGDFCTHPPATADPAEIGPVGAVIVAVKSLHLPAVRAGIGPLLGPATLVVPLLNGVDAHEALAPAVGRERMGKGLTRIISEVAAPGEIRHIGVDPYVALAEWDGRASARAKALVAALAQAGVQAEIPADIDAALWHKFLFVCSLGGVCAVCRMPLGPVRSHPASRDLLRRAMEEIAAIAAARNVALPPDASRPRAGDLRFLSGRGHLFAAARHRGRHPLRAGRLERRGGAHGRRSGSPHARPRLHPRGAAPLRAGGTRRGYRPDPGFPYIPRTMTSVTTEERGTLRGAGPGPAALSSRPEAPPC